MSVDIRSLTISPNSFKRGQQNATITFEGIVGSLNDNNVSLEFFIDPEAPVFIINNAGNRVKSIKWKEPFKITTDIYSKAITLTITSTPPTPGSCALRLEAIDAKGFRSRKNSFLIFS